MSTDQLSLLETGVWLIPVLLIGVLVGVVGLVRYWQRVTLRDLKTVLPSIRRWENECLELAELTRGYSAGDRMPFGDLKAHMDKQLDRVNDELVALKHRYAHIRSRSGRYTLQGWKLFAGAVFYWFEWHQLQRECSQLIQQVSGIAPLIQDVRHFMETLFDQGRLVSIDALESLELQMKVKQLADRLSAGKFSGDTFEGLVNRVGQLDEELRQIPEFFLRAEEQEVNQETNIQIISDVYEIISRVQPAHKDLFDRFQDLEKRYTELSARINALKQRIGTTRQLIFSLPAEVELSIAREKLQALETIAATLQSTLSRLEVESIPLVDRDAEQACQSVESLEKQLTAARRHLNSLEPMVADLVERQALISTRFADLAKRQVHPVQWQASQRQLTALSSQVASLGPVKKPRSLDSLEQDLQQARALLEIQNQLGNRIDEINQLQTELLLLLDSPEVRSSGDWQQSARNTLVRVAGYDPVNWPEAERSVRLVVELNDLGTSHAMLVPKDRHTGIPEGELEEFVPKIRTLVDRYRAIGSRIGKIEARLKQVQEVEKNAQGHFQTSSQLFFQMELVVNSNPFLESAAGRDIKRLAAQIEQCSQALDERQVGIIEKKAQKVREFTQALEGAGNGWLKKLNLEIEKMKNGLAEKLDRLSSMAILEDQAVLRARALLAQDLQSSVVGKTAAVEQISLQDLLALLKFRNDFWQNCVAATQELEEKVEKPLADVFQEAVREKAEAEQLLQRAQKVVPIKAAWPPTSVSLDAERQEVASLGDKWSLINSRPTQAIWAVRKYSELGGSYRGLSGKLQSAIDKARQEQQAVAELEAALDNYSEMWRLQEEANSRDSRAVGQIRELRADVRRGSEEIKRKWLGGASHWQAQRVYQDTARALRELSLDLYNATVEVGSDTENPIEIGIDGLQRSKSRDRRWR